MSEEILDLATKLEKEGDKSRLFFESLHDGDWGVRVYDDGAKWDVSQVLTHVTETEADIPRLIRNILDGEGGVAEGFDLDAYNLAQVERADPMPPADRIHEFGVRRSATVRFVAGLAERDLRRRGRHPFLGESEVAEMIRLMMLHLHLHQRDIRRALMRRQSP